MVRLRPRNTEELEADLDFADCVEIQPEAWSLSCEQRSALSECVEIRSLKDGEHVTVLFVLCS